MFSFFRRRSETDLTPILQRLDTLEAKMRSLGLEWTEAYDKISHGLDRIRKRSKAQEREPEPDNGGPVTEAQLFDLARQKGMIR